MKLKPYNEVFFVHYQCGDLNQNEVPITSLCIFSKNKIEVFSDADEAQNIKAYCERIMQLCDEGLIPVHWNQNRPSYGIDHILSRYKKLTGDTIQIEYRDSINLSDFLWNKYGEAYIGHPRLDKLAEINGFRGHRENEYGNKTFPENRLSLLAKIYDGELRGTLRTNLNTSPPTDENQKKEIYILPENIEPIYKALAPYFQGQETGLRQLLEGKAIIETLIINGAIKHFAYSFCFLAMDNKISSPKNDVLFWFCKYFVDKQNKPLNLGTIKKYFEHDDIKFTAPMLENVKELILNKQK